MIRIACLFVVMAFITATGKATSSNAVYEASQSLRSSVDSNRQSNEVQSQKNNKDSKLREELEKAAEPLLVLKSAIENELPQEELNTIKKMAFQIFLIARRYL